MAARPRTLRILTWNVCELRGDLRALVEAIRDLAPDILLLNEAPRLVLPTTRLRWFARQVGMEILEGGFGRRGLAILATDSIARLVVSRGAHGVRQQITDGKSTYPRGVAAMRLSFGPGRELIVAAAHLALQTGNRVAHAQHLLALVERAGVPVVLGGDLNEKVGGDATRILREALEDPGAASDSPSFPAVKPRARIDALLTSPGVRVLADETVTHTAHVDAERFSAASDHLPVLLEIEVPAA